METTQVSFNGRIQKTVGYKLKDIIDSLPFEAFAERALKIVTMQGKLEWLDINVPQQKVHWVLEQQRLAGLPMRAIILKARREGVSTYVEGRFFREVNRKPMRYACVCSADIDATNKVFKMAKLFQDEIPGDIRRPTEFSNRKEIIYAAPHRSEFLCQTAGKEVLGRGGLTHYLHCTEFAFWGNAKEQLGGAAQEVPDDPETMVIIESTANGMGGAFYDLFTDAVERYRKTKSLDGYMPIFLPWFIFDYYRRTPPADWEPSAEERKIQVEFNLDIEQLYWRNWAIENKCQGDLRLFKQEYPATWQEAFQSTGSPVFSPGTIAVQAKTIREDIQYGLFDYKTGTFMPGESRYGWQLLDGPGGEEHVIGVDTREHRLSDDKNEKSERDFDGAVVLGRKAGQRRVKAIFHGRMGQKDFGYQVLGAAKYFNEAWVVPEVPQGMMVLQVLVDAGYPNIYSRLRNEDTWRPEETENLGYRTTTVTRPMLVNEALPYIKSGVILSQFREIVDEMRTFIYDKMGKPIHMPGKHDDILFGLFLAIQGDIYCPKSVPMVAIPATTGGYVHSHYSPYQTDRDLARMGVIDRQGEEEDEDTFDEESWYHTV